MKKVLAFLKDFWIIHFLSVLLFACGSHVAFDPDSSILLLRVLGAFMIFLGGVLEGVSIVVICLD